MSRKILGASLGMCVHVAGLMAFLNICEEEGYPINYLGPAVAVERLLDAVSKEKPDLVAVSYRLSAEAAEKLFNDLADGIRKRGLKGIEFLFGGTRPTAAAAERSGIFSRVFTGGETHEEIRSFLRGSAVADKIETFPADLPSRIAGSYPVPLLRHHFGLSSLDDTVEGAKKIAESRVLDILSLGPDQNAQEHFFHPELMDPLQDGAGGVPLRSAGDLRRIYEATRCGNFPLVRCYSGTNDLLAWAEMSVENIRNAWGAIPLFWYSELDGRSQRPLLEAIKENREAIRWYAQRNVPVEVNEAHQWSLRYAHDALAVAVAFLAAYNAKKLKVRHYVSQYMFNTPPGTSPAMDLAKMLAKKELIESLTDSRFTVFTQVRAGLAHFSSDSAIAKGQLASSGILSLALRPHILHVVGFSEGDHAATADEIIESCKIIRGMLRNSLKDFPDLMLDRRVKRRKKILVSEARILLDAIGQLDDPAALWRALQTGLLDAPQLRGRPPARGEVVTGIIDGACLAINPRTGRAMTESSRLKTLGLVRQRGGHDAMKE